MRARQRLGQWGEDQAVAELLRRGWTIVERNWRCPAGEIDIVAHQGQTWVFVEVRTRRGREFGTPEESLTAVKQEHMLSSAEHYISEHELDDVSWRLDLIAIETDRFGNLERLQVLENVVEGQWLE